MGMGKRRIGLRDARISKGLTQAQLARRVHRPQSFISKLETGVIDDPGLETAKALGRALDVDPLALRLGPVREREAIPA